MARGRHPVVREKNGWGGPPVIVDKNGWGEPPALGYEDWG